MSGQQGDKPWVDEATGTGMPWPPSEPAPGCMDAPPLVPTPKAVERWGNQWWRLVHSDGSAVEPPSDTLQVVMVCGDGYFHEQGNDTTQEFVDDGRWFGPVLERPVKP